MRKGQYVHLHNPTTGLIENQGRIAWIGTRRVIVRLFSWVDGRENGSVVMPTGKFWSMNPALYSTAAEMRAAWARSGHPLALRARRRG